MVSITYISDLLYNTENVVQDVYSMLLSQDLSVLWAAYIIFLIVNAMLFILILST